MKQLLPTLVTVVNNSEALSVRKYVSVGHVWTFLVLLLPLDLFTGKTVAFVVQKQQFGCYVIEKAGVKHC